MTTFGTQMSTQDRLVSTIHLDRSELARVAAHGAGGDCQWALAAVLAGEVELAGVRYARGDLFVHRDLSEIAATREGASLGLVEVPASGASGAPSVRVEPMRFYRKYQSWVGQVLMLGDQGEDCMEPWSIYLARLEPDDPGRVELHVHHHVENILFFIGSRGRAAAQVIAVEGDGRLTTHTVFPGDIAAVRPGLTHAVVPPPGQTHANILIMNTMHAGYEREGADFHVVSNVAMPPDRAEHETARAGGRVLRV